MKIFGLIGFPLGHSFSKKYFTEKFETLNIADTHKYELFQIENIQDLPKILSENNGISGLNVTIPHKLNVIPFLSEIDPKAKEIGAVNVIKILPNGKLKGYNSDYYGFKTSLEKFIGTNKNLKALILGNGGATKAVIATLKDLNIPFQIVSRTKQKNIIDYKESKECIHTHKLIINCSPLGTYPNVDTFPDIDYSQITNEHLCYDLVYNPEITKFMEKSQIQGAKVINGMEMLIGQAEKAWEIWNEQ